MESAIQPNRSVLGSRIRDPRTLVRTEGRQAESRRLQILEREVGRMGDRDLGHDLGHLSARQEEQFELRIVGEHLELSGDPDRLVYDCVDPVAQVVDVAVPLLRDEVEALQTPAPEIQPSNDGEGLLDRLGRWYDRTTQSLDVQARIDLYKDRLARASEHIIHLIVVFMLQTVVFPLLFMWVGWRLLRALIAAL